MCRILLSRLAAACATGPSSPEGAPTNVMPRNNRQLLPRAREAPVASAARGVSDRTNGLSAPSAVTRKGDHHVVPKTSSNIAQTQGPGPSDGLNRRATALTKIAGAAAVALLASAHAFANPAENSSRMALEHHACAVVMGLHQPGDLYDTCVRSLNKTLSELDQARLASTDRSACRQEGLKPGTPAFAVCVEKAEQSPADAGRYEAIVPVR